VAARWGRVAVATKFDLTTGSTDTIRRAWVEHLCANVDVPTVVGRVGGLPWVGAVCARLSVVVVLNMDPGDSSCKLCFDWASWMTDEFASDSVGCDGGGRAGHLNKLATTSTSQCVDWWEIFKTYGSCIGW